MGPALARALDRTTNFSIQFLIFCIYLNIVKNYRIILMQIENSKVVRILKLGTDWVGQFVIFSDLCMKGK